MGLTSSKKEQVIEVANDKLEEVISARNVRGQPDTQTMSQIKRDSQSMNRYQSVAAISKPIDDSGWGEDV